MVTVPLLDDSRGLLPSSSPSYCVPPCFVIPVRGSGFRIQALFVHGNSTLAILNMMLIVIFLPIGIVKQ